MRRRLGQDEHLLELAEINRGRNPHREEKARAFAMDALNTADQQAAREDSVEAGGHDGVAGADVLRAIGVLEDDAVIDQSGDDAAGARALIEAVERTVVIVDQQDARGVGADGDNFAGR